jgi:NAD(P)-dependent dehydrogenase (short-subunit alcohol dehydrogenase family)
MHVTERLFGIEGKVAAVFGATPIGEATDALFREAGAKVELVPIISDPGLADPAAALDPADEGAVEARLDRIIAAHGRLDVLIYDATGLGSYPFLDLTLAQWDRIHGINMRGAFVSMREAVRRMIPTGGGRIVALSTIGSLHPVLYGNTAYGSSKAGLNALVRNIAFDHAKDGILANCVLHGAVNVGALPADCPPVSGPGMQPGRMMMGPGTAEELAAAFLYLCSPAGRFLTGQKLTLDGGFLIS